ncbi:DUF4097 family beta strand repeat-containing protein [Aeromicrobium wangtongii]|uniref:DUF4097 domain-containing protein n=1 Tax=Aeromicrobium wangtongii TaxID=2969247 RepID=A0ABY5M976_9ACTN|nr:DUF4097 family beta strand repeat-containing protein [Aeromicrobium wangtongii]MCD9197194.1 DUF4097 domain-containing protein [Aeromicrobium wangtongii]UUP14690.1 DUF4097 domain-containing protein [Aeromicrobium wangtongii]
MTDRTDNIDIEGTDAGEELVADYDVRSPASRTLLTVVGTILAVAVVGGLVLGVSLLKRGTTTSTTDIALDDPAQIVIDAGSADVRLVQGSPGIVRVRADVTSGLRKTDFQVGRRGDVIKLVAGCQEWLNPGCGVEATLELPKGFPVVVRTTTGDVAVRDIAAGVLKVQSADGDFTGLGLKLDELDVTTTSGDISAAFAKQPYGVKMTSRSGDVSATMIDGKRTYAVTTESRSGDVSSGLESDDKGEGFVRARTGSGDISLAMS